MEALTHRSWCAENLGTPSNERLEFIGDKGVRTQEDARSYLRNGPIAMYEREGFGLFLVYQSGFVDGLFI